MNNANWNISDLQWTIHMPIKLTSTLEGDLIVEIIKVKPGLYISRKDRKHMVANTFFKLSRYVPWSSHSCKWLQCAYFSRNICKWYVFCMFCNCYDYMETRLKISMSLLGYRLFIQWHITESCDSQCMKNFVPYTIRFIVSFCFSWCSQKNDGLNSGDNGLSTVKNFFVHPCMWQIFAISGIDVKKVLQFMAPGKSRCGGGRRVLVARRPGM